jgi:hypothetical protein
MAIGTRLDADLPSLNLCILAAETYKEKKEETLVRFLY